MKTTITKLHSTYKLDNGKESITCEVKNGKISLFTKFRGPDFVFQDSDPARVSRIADLFKTASILINREEIEL